jgi:hypothetical protein
VREEEVFERKQPTVREDEVLKGYSTSCKGLFQST